MKSLEAGRYDRRMKRLEAGTDDRRMKSGGWKE
jgi:hypothetical protein